MKVELPKAIIFDHDGTLVDSAPTVCAILNRMRHDLGKIPIDFEAIRSEISRGGSDLIARALEIPYEESEEAVKRFRSIYLETPTKNDILYPFVRETLESLKKSGIKLCISTNKPRNLVTKILTDLKLLHYFDYMNAGGDLARKKPDPENIFVCLKFLSMEPREVCLVGDSVVDQKTAENSGVPFYFFTSGYDDGVERKKAILCFENYQELMNFLDN